MSASPMEVMKGLWGGELPPFDTIDEADELIGALVMGLWNRLTRHQDRASPFRLMRVDTASTREGLAAFRPRRALPCCRCQARLSAAANSVFSFL